MVDTFGMAAHVTFETVKAGLHCSFRISRHMLPLELMLGWYTFVAKLTCQQTHVMSDFAVHVEMQAYDYAYIYGI